MTMLLDYDLQTEESRKAFINKEESGLYGAVDSNGNRVAILMEKGIMMELSTYQSNGWANVAEYDARGYLVGETVEKYKDVTTSELELIAMKRRREEVWEQLQRASRLNLTDRNALRKEYEELLRATRNYK